jgi:hypothetical protein
MGEFLAVAGDGDGLNDTLSWGKIIHPIALSSQRV